MATNYERELLVPARDKSPYSRFILENLGDGDTLKLSCGDQGKGVPNIFRIQMISVNIVCDANVANRVVHIQPNLREMGVATTLARYASGNFTAGQDGNFSIGEHYTATYNAVFYYGYAIGVHKLILEGDDYINFSITDDQAGDVWRVAVVAEYLNRKLGL